MKRVALFVVVVLAAALAQPVLGEAPIGAGPSAPQDALEGLAWLEGEWHRQIRRGLSIER